MPKLEPIPINSTEPFCDRHAGSTMKFGISYGVEVIRVWADQRDQSTEEHRPDSPDPESERKHPAKGAVSILSHDDSWENLRGEHFVKGHHQERAIASRGAWVGLKKMLPLGQQLSQLGG